MEEIEKQNASQGVTKLPVQKDKERAVEIATEYIKQCKANGEVPRIVEGKKLLVREFGKMYTDKTFHNWIKNIFPSESRKPGRPKKAKI